LTDTDSKEYTRQWEAEESFVLKGWDFSHISERWDCPAPPWDYQMIVKSYLRDEDILLDMGTGGGEVLLEIGHPYKNTYATEGYAPNLALCREVLAPLGITVAQVFDGDKLPFADEVFDFIINRHESFDLSEVNRTLKRGGYFFTQQVGYQNTHALEAFLNDGLIMKPPAHAIGNYADTLAQIGFQIIIRDEAKFPIKFFDVGALVFYAKACVWNFPGFTVKTHFEKLCEYQREVEENGFIQATGHRLLLAARKL